MIQCIAIQGKPGVWYGEGWEDAQLPVLARFSALAGSGSEMVQGEGPCIVVADVSAITCKVYDLGTDRDAATGTEVTPAPTLTSANVFVLRAAGWTKDLHGYNFRHDLAAAYLADPDEWRLLEYRITLTDGTILPLSVRVKTASIVRGT